ncbi:MAG: NAD(P)-dependent oxidoreductase [Lautropia sp.]
MAWKHAACAAAPSNHHRTQARNRTARGRSVSPGGSMTDTIAFIGLGAMGAEMAANLRQAGYRLRVWNRSPERTGPFAAAGDTVCATPAEAVRGARFVVSIVADDQATRAVMLGADGVIGAAAAGTVVIDSATITPAMAREIAAAAAARGVDYLDAPVSGSLPQARGRELIFMVGGSAEALARAEPVMAAMGRKSLHMGGPGAGATMKLVNNMIAGTVNTALAEALAVGEAAGLKAQQMFDLLSEGAVGSRLIKSKIPKMTGRDFTPQFQLALMEKDLRYFLALAQEVDRPTPVASIARSQLLSARRDGLGGLDVSSVFLRVAGEQPGGKVTQG